MFLQTVDQQKQSHTSRCYYSTNPRKIQDFLRNFSKKMRKISLQGSKAPHANHRKVDRNMTISKPRRIYKLLCGFLAMLGCNLVLPGAYSGIGAYAATDITPYNWYCKNNDTHTIPVLDADQQWIEQYDAYYVDRNVKKGDRVIYLTISLL